MHSRPDDTAAVPAQPPASEALSTWALFLSMIAIVGFAMSVGAFGLDRIGLSISAGLLSLTSFVASMFFFSADAEDS
jgi:flagellar biogenesis protein FliO